MRLWAVLSIQIIIADGLNCVTSEPLVLFINAMLDDRQHKCFSAVWICGLYV